MAQRILLVEDDNRTRKMFAELLRQNGYEAFEAENGRVAMETMRHQPVELVVTNMKMPVMDGVETILAIHRLYPDVKIIAMSGSGIGTSESCLKIARTLGSHKTLTKPLIPEEFLRTIRDLIG